MNNQQQKTFPLQPSVSLFEETILKLKERKRDIDVALLYFFTNTTASFKSFNDKIPEDMKFFLGKSMSTKFSLLKFMKNLM